MTANSGHDARRTPLSGRVHPSGGRRATPTRGVGVCPPPPAPPTKNAAAARGTSSRAPWRPRSGTAATRRRAELTLDLSRRREAEPGRHSKVPRHPRVTGPREGRPLVPHAGLAGRGGGKHGVLEDVFFYQVIKSHGSGVRKLQMTHEKPPLLLPLPGETRPLRIPRGRLHRETSGRSRARRRTEGRAQSRALVGGKASRAAGLCLGIRG